MKGRTGSTLSRTKYVKCFRVETSCYRVVLRLKFIVTVELLYDQAESDFVQCQTKMRAFASRICSEFKQIELKVFGMESHYICPFRYRLMLCIKKFTKNVVTLRTEISFRVSLTFQFSDEHPRHFIWGSPRGGCHEHLTECRNRSSVAL